MRVLTDSNLFLVIEERMDGFWATPSDPDATWTLNKRSFTERTSDLEEVKLQAPDRRRGAFASVQLDAFSEDGRLERIHGISAGKIAYFGWSRTEDSIYLRQVLAWFDPMGKFLEVTIGKFCILFRLLVV